MGAGDFFFQGSIAVAGSAVKWLRDNMGIIKTTEEINDLAAGVKDNGGVVFVTAFSGLFAPYWRPDVRGSILGLSQHTTKHHLARATLEATCFQTRAVSLFFVLQRACVVCVNVLACMYPEAMAENNVDHDIIFSSEPLDS